MATTITALCMDITTAEPCTQTLVLTGYEYDTNTALKAAKKVYDTDTFKVVAITSLETTGQIYGMLETDFIKLARKMTPDRHFINEDGTVDTETETEDTTVPEETEKPKRNKK